MLDADLSRAACGDFQDFHVAQCVPDASCGGFAGEECPSNGRYAVEECGKYLAGVPLTWQVTGNGGDNGVS